MSWYKARAIYNGGGRFELLYDRQTASGKDAQPLVDWLNNTAYKIMRKYLIKEGIEGSSDAKFEVAEGDMHLSASPNASYGYLYIRAWTNGSEQDMEDASTIGMTPLAPIFVISKSSTDTYFAG